MRKFKFLMLSIFAISILLTSCGETIDEAQVLVDFLESADSPIDVATPGMAKYISAGGVDGLNALLPDGAYVIDIRDKADYDLGHIQNAVWVGAAGVIAHLATAETGTKKIVIACYTGQQAGFVTSLVNLSGYDASSLKFGMSGWNKSLDNITDASTNSYDVDSINVTEKAAESMLPMLETGFETAQEILDAQVDEVNTAGFGEAKIAASEVFTNPEKYYIVNYWPANHYELGHIPQAIQYTPHLDILSTEALKTLPTDKPVVVYCYSGQTSAFTTAYLRVLGYDAKSLLYGVNGFATDWAASKAGIFSWDVDTFGQDYDLYPMN